MKKKLVIIFLFFSIYIYAETRIYEDITKLQPGDSGYVLTVFSGIYPDTVPARVVSVMPSTRLSSSGGKSYLVLIRLYGKAKETGVAAGMSGSPFYVDGKLVGALAYTWGFGKEPYAGVTSIKDMQYWLHHIGDEGAPFDDIGSINRLFTPLVINADNKYLKDIAETFWEGKVSVLSANKIDSFKVDKLLPGMSIGAILIDGDLSVAAIGTITSVDDKYVLAFGHPLFNAGSIKLPVAPVYVHLIYPSYQLSFKMGSPLNKIGALIEDRDKCIIIEKDAKYNMIPLLINVNGKEFHYGIADYSKFLSYLTSMALLNSVQSVSFTDADNALFYADMRIYYDTLSFGYRNILHSSFLLKDIISFPSSIINMFFNNTYEKPTPDSMKIFVSTRKTEGRAFIEDIVTDRYVYHANDTLRGYVVVRKYNGEKEKLNFSFSIPLSMEGKNLIIEADNAADYITNNISLYPDSLYIINDKIKDMPFYNQVVISLYTMDINIERDNGRISMNLLPDIIAMRMAGKNYKEMKTKIPIYSYILNSKYILSSQASKKIKIVFKEDR